LSDRRYLGALAVSLVALVVALASLGALGAVAASQGHSAPLVACWSAPTEDSKPSTVPCDYRDGAYYPATGTLYLPPCDDDAPGRPIQGTCWLLDDGGIAIWPAPYQGDPIVVLMPSQDGGHAK
jgi:hypothetical protein